MAEPLLTVLRELERTPQVADPHVIGHWFGKAADEIEQLQEKLPCGHRKIDMDDSYGGCVFCGFKDGYHEYEAEIGLWRKYADHLPDCACWDKMDSGRFFVRSDWECTCGLRELQTKDTCEVCGHPDCEGTHKAPSDPLDVERSVLDAVTDKDTK